MKRICVHRNNDVRVGVRRRFRGVCDCFHKWTARSEKALVSHPATNILRENRLIVTRSLGSKCWEMLQHRQWRIQGILTFTPNWGPKDRKKNFFWDRPPLLSKGLDDHPPPLPPPLSESLGRPQIGFLSINRYEILQAQSVMGRR